MRRERELIDVAAALFYERGYADASMQDIADAVGILKGSLYHYVASKEALLYRLLDATQDELQAIVDTVAALPDPTPLERLHEYIRRRVLFAGRHRGRMAVYHQEAGHLTVAHQEALAARRQQETRFVEALVLSADPTLDRHVVAMTLRDCAYWVFRWAPPGDVLEAELLSETCATFLLGGVTASVPPGRRAATAA